MSRGRTISVAREAACWEHVEMLGHVVRLEVVAHRGAAGGFGISLNDKNVVTNVGEDSALQRKDVIVEVNGVSIIGSRLTRHVPALGDMTLTILRPLTSVEAVQGAFVSHVRSRRQSVASAQTTSSASSSPASQMEGALDNESASLKSQLPNTSRCKPWAAAQGGTPTAISSTRSLAAAA